MGPERSRHATELEINRREDGNHAPPCGSSGEEGPGQGQIAVGFGAILEESSDHGSVQSLETDSVM